MVGNSSVRIARPGVRPGRGRRKSFGECSGRDGYDYHAGRFRPFDWRWGYIGTAYRDGFEWGIDDINKKGGVNGRQINITFYDDQLSAANALVDVRKLAEDNKVFAIIGASGSAATVGVLAYVKRNGIPFYNGVAGTPAVLHPFARNVFSGTITPNDTVGAAMAAEIQHAGYKRVALIYENGAFGTSGADATEASLKTLGISVVSKQSYVFGVADWTPQLTSAITNQADVIVLWSYEPESGQIPKQARSLGYRGAVFGSDSSCDLSVPKTGGAAVEGNTCAYVLPYFQGETDQAPMAAYLKSFKERFPDAAVAGRPNLYDLQGYLDAYNVTHALQLAGKTLTWDSFISATESIKDYRGTPISPPISFSETDHQGSRYLSFHVLQNGAYHKLPYVYSNGQIVTEG